MGSLGCSVVKNPSANAGDASSIPGSGRSAGEGNSNSPPYSCLGNPMDRGASQATAHGVAKELDTTERLNSNDKNGVIKCLREICPGNRYLAAQPSLKSPGAGREGWGKRDRRAGRLSHPAPDTAQAGAGPDSQRRVWMSPAQIAPLGVRCNLQPTDITGNKAQDLWRPSSQKTERTAPSYNPRRVQLTFLGTISQA